MALSSLVFSVQKKEAVLVAPSEPTPHEFKRLSDIDDQDGLRFHVPVIQFYRYAPSMTVAPGGGKRDPAAVIREALARALVYYYPLAGRLREGPNRKLLVECTGEGALFIEADADVSLEQFGDALQPPFPYLEELLFDVEGSGGILNCPLLLFQVTRLLCGGFITAFRFSHTIFDGQGILQFMNVVGEMARGLPAPAVAPVWRRELLDARDPPRPTLVHREYDEVADTNGTIVPLDDMARRSFFFGPREVAALRRRVPPHLRGRSTFDVLTAYLWRSRTAALRPDPEEEVRIILVVNARGRCRPPLPSGYYGNALAFPAAVTDAGELCSEPLGYALELVGRAKSGVDSEYMSSVADLMVLRGRPHLTVVRSYIVSDLTRFGFADVDLGWGRAVYGGPAKDDAVPIPGMGSYYLSFRNGHGEDGILVPICLPAPAMERFVAEMEALTKEDEPTTTSSPPPPLMIRSMV